jgi:DNA replication and repair protein RecF
MYVSDLALTDFRSYHDVVVTFEPGVSVLLGPNGQGKTNLVEAVAYLSTFSSHRVAGDAPLVRRGAARAVIRCRIVRGDRHAVVEVEVVAGRANRARLNRAPVRRTRDVLGILRSVLFAPEDLALVKGEPDGRRRYLDDLLVMLTPRLASVLGDYERILRQRGALLRSAAGRGVRASADALRTLDVWDGHLAAAGAQIVAARLAVVAALAPHVAAAYAGISGDVVAAVIGYRSAVGDEPPTADAAGIEERLLDEMTRLRARELERGVNLVGPHRDDLVLALGDLPARGYASHGESWSFALALRLASYHLLREDASGEWAGDGEPVLILDDVFAELDARRRRRLAELVADAGQVLVTAAAAEDVPIDLDGARYDVREGTVRRAG